MAAARAGVAGSAAMTGPAGPADRGRAGPAASVAVIGPHILDVLGRPVEAIPPGQGSVRLAEIRATAAGTAAGTAVDLAKLGFDVTVFGAIGSDLLADVLLGALARHGVGTAGLVRKHSAQTSATILPIRPNGERPALHVPGATRLLTLPDVDLAALAAARAVVLGGPDALAGLSGEDLAAIVATARQAGALVVMDVLHPGSPRDFARISGALAGADWFWPNAEQLLALTGRAAEAPAGNTSSLPGLRAAIEDVLALGTGGVAVTLGPDGCLVTTRAGEVLRIPAIEVAVVDTTGCGDAFDAGMLAGLLRGCDPEDAAWLGVACGALVATGLGSDAGIESFGQVLDFLRASNPEVAGRVAGPPVGAAVAGPAGAGPAGAGAAQWPESAAREGADR
jgi:sugar/nucleoside kinase (ribokinase family)